MGSKRVLVVDDSRSARLVLKRQLKQHGIAVDEVESAEDALQYLLHNKPHAIFMDHTMPGLDGLQALRIIKGNPATGLIPIMMYTSKDGGGVYVGQARALGAVGVLPKGAESADMEAVLNSMHLLDSDEESEPVHAVQVLPAAVSPELDDLARESADEAMIRLLKPHLDAQARRLHSSFKAELRVLAASLQPPQTKAVQRRWTTVLAGLVAGVLMTTGTYKVLLADSRDVVSPPVAELKVTDFSAGQGGLSLASVTQPGTGSGRGKVADLRSLEWALNQDGRFAFADTPFDDRRLSFVNELILHLDREGFEGVVHMTAHAGKFCMIQDGEGIMTLAPDDLPVTECEDFGMEMARLHDAQALQSQAFADLTSQAPLLEDSGIRLVAEPAIEQIPRIEYPKLDEELLAGEWNAIARENQRIEVKLVP
ncbi:hypothetical protein LCGC14_0125400 [marine sediment metagenome]